MQFQRHELPNGLEIIAEVNPRAHSAAYGFFVNTGARDETDQLSGVSHFLEHMVFKGTTRRSAEDVNRELDELGSHSNAYTSEEHTVYFAAILPEYQQPLLDLLADILRPALRDDDFHLEKQVILEEIAKYEDQPPFGAAEKCMAHYFGDHPLGRNVLGTTESVGALTPRQMRDYFATQYSPGNIVLAAAGKVDFPQLTAAAQRSCGDWPRQAVRRATPSAPARRGFHLLHKETAAQEYLVQLAAGPACDDPDRFAARLLAMILGDDSGSRLFWELIDTGLADTASMSSSEYVGTGALMTFVACQPDDAAEVLQRVNELLAAAERAGVTAEELRRAQSKVCSQLVLSGERAANRMFSVGGHWLARREYCTIRESLDRYQRVTTADLHRVLERFPPSVATTVAVGPLTTLST